MKFQHLLFAGLAAFLLQSCGPSKSISSSMRGETDKVTFSIEVAEDARGSAAENYLNQYSDIAVQEMRRTGIPASIKLAQGLLESASGTSMLAQESNNHFGIKCGSNWTGERYEHYDDDKDHTGELIKSCFRVYPYPQQSYIDHSDFLRDPKKEFRYGKLFQLDPTDYRGWARGLREAGYASDPAYPDKLISLIERLELYRFDVGSTPAPSPSSGRIVAFNTHRAILAESGETLRRIAQIAGVDAFQLQRANGGRYTIDQPLQAGTPVYLEEIGGGTTTTEQPVIIPYRDFHTVTAGDTLFSISKKYDISVQSLMDLNGLTSSTISIGQRLRVR